MRAAAAAAVVVAVACWGGAARAESGKALIDRFECARCHDVPGARVVAPEKRCVGCHQDIRRGAFDVDAATLANWQSRVHHLLDVPSLQGLSGRVKRDWLAAFLLRPHDLRPRLPEMMPRLALSPEQADAVARHIVKTEPDARPLAYGAASVERGRALFQEKGCALCHVVGALPLTTTATTLPSVAAEQLRVGMLLAPDLRHARERMTPRAVLAWIQKPSAQKPGTAMPDVDVTVDEALALTRFVFEAEVPGPSTPKAPQRLPVLSRKVGWDEVNRAVFGKTCWHCHSDPALSTGGDGGPGNTGGFGFAGKRLSFARYGDVVRGSRDASGARTNLLVPDESGEPPLLRHLLARQVEERGGVVDGVRGMPLGLPGLTPEELQLVESWLAQGAPR